MANTFHGPLDAHIAIPAPQCMSGGTMNFNFGSDRPSNNGTCTRRQLKPFSTVPFASDPDFVDRPEILGWLREKCAGAGTRAALVGLGGVGKSQLAIQYAHSIRDANPQTFVFWVHASSRIQFEEAYRDIANRLQLPDRDGPKTNVLRLVSDWLRDEANGQWFMVLDNVDREDTFFRSRKHLRDEAEADVRTSLAIYLPQSRNGSILVTSRNRDAAARLVGSNRIKEVLAMDEGEGLQLLRKKLCQPSPDDSAVKLLSALGHIPLAITQAAAYINRRVRMSVAEYLNDFHRNSKKRERLLNWDLGDLRRDESASNSILTTWQLSFEQIRHERPSAAELLSLMSFFNPQGIPEWVLRKFRMRSIEAADSGDSDDEEDDEEYDDNDEDEEDDEDEDSKFDEDLDILRTYSLISATAENNTYEMHPLVQFCMRAWLSSFGEVDQWHHRFVVLLAQELDFGYLAKCQQLVPHAEPLFHSTPAEETLTAWAKVLCSLASYASRRGRLTTAQQIAEKALSVTEKVLGFNDNATLRIAAVLMKFLEYQKFFQEAEKLGQRVLQGHKKEPGERNPLILRIMGNLASVMQQQGRCEESEKLVQQMIEEHKEDRDPRTAVCLADVLQELGQLEVAEKFLWQTLETNKEQLGERHRDTLLLTSNLAALLEKQGQWPEAEKLLRQTLEANKEQLGERHLNTVQNTIRLATALESQGQSLEAEKLLCQVTEGLIELEKDDTLVFSTTFGLLWMLLAHGKLEEAANLLHRVLSGRKILREQNHLSLHCTHYLAILLKMLNRYAEAAELYQQACTEYVAQFGPQDPKTIECYEQLAELQNRIQQTSSDEETVFAQPAQDTSLE